jgi:hypothetical protein
MSTPVEQRLRRALAQQAEATTTSPDGWRRIQARRPQGAGAGRPALKRWTVLAPAAAFAVVLLVLAAVGSGGDRDRTLRVTGDPEPLHLLPTGVEPRFRLIGVTTGTAGDPPPPSTYRAFGRRAADGVAVQASVVITMPGDRARNGATPEPEPLRVLGHDVILATDPFGQRTARWHQPDGREVGLLTYGLSPAELVTVVESLLPGDASKDAPSLPAGFSSIGSGSMPGGAPPTVTQTWQSDDGASFMLTVVEEAGATVDKLAMWMPGGQARKLRGTTAIYVSAREAYLAWPERPETTVVVQARGLSEPELVAIAEGLRPVSGVEWRELTARFRPPPTPADVPPVSGPPPGVAPSPDTWLVFVPVKSRVAPPCRGIHFLELAERRGGQEVACYNVTAPALDAGDVAGAAVRQDRSTGTWTVELRLTEAGTARLAGLFRDVGSGGQYAVVVDLEVVAAQRFDASPSGTGVITGLDEQTARSIAERLTR